MRRHRAAVACSVALVAGALAISEGGRAQADVALPPCLRSLGEPRAVAFTPDGDLLARVESPPGTWSVASVEPTTMTVESLGIAGMLLAITPDAGTLVVGRSTGQGGGVFVVDRVTRAEQRLLGTFESTSLGISGDGDLVGLITASPLLADDTDGTLDAYLLRRSTGVATRLSGDDLTMTPWARLEVRLSSDGLVAWLSHTPHANGPAPTIYEIDLATGDRHVERRRVVPGGGAYYAFADGVLTLTDRVSGDVTTIALPTTSLTLLGSSPDGRFLAGGGSFAESFAGGTIIDLATGTSRHVMSRWDTFVSAVSNDGLWAAGGPMVARMDGASPFRIRSGVAPSVRDTLPIGETVEAVIGGGGLAGASFDFPPGVTFVPSAPATESGLAGQLTVDADFPPGPTSFTATAPGICTTTVELSARDDRLEVTAFSPHLAIAGVGARFNVESNHPFGLLSIDAGPDFTPVPYQDKGLALDPDAEPGWRDVTISETKFGRTESFSFPQSLLVRNAVGMYFPAGYSGPIVDTVRGVPRRGKVTTKGLTVPMKENIYMSHEAAVLSVTVSSTTATGRLAIKGTAVDRGIVIPYRSGRAVTTTVVVPISPDAVVQFTPSSGSVHLRVERLGFLGDGTGAYAAFEPIRVLDTRDGPKLDYRYFIQMKMLNGSVPTYAIAVRYSVIEPTATGYASLDMSSGPEKRYRTDLRHVQYAGGRNTTGFAILPAYSPWLSVEISRGRAHLVLDIVGVFYMDDHDQPSDDGQWFVGPPVRLLDTVKGVGAPKGKTKGPVTFDLVVPPGALPEGAQAAVVAITASASKAEIEVWSGPDRPGLSTMFVSTGDAQTTWAVIPLDADGSIHAATTGKAHVTVDLLGYVALR